MRIRCCSGVEVLHVEDSSWGGSLSRAPKTVHTLVCTAPPENPTGPHSLASALRGTSPATTLSGPR